MPSLLSDPLKEQKSQHREKNHNRQIVSEKEDARFGIVKKGKGKPQKHISRDLPLEECMNPVEGDSCKEAKPSSLSQLVTVSRTLSGLFCASVPAMASPFAMVHSG